MNYPWGRDLVGQFIITANGHMSAQLMRRDRPTFASGDAAKGTPEEYERAFRGYITFFGTYDVDEEKHIMTSHPEGSLFPNLIGVDQVRFYEINGDRVTFRTMPRSEGGVTVTGVLVWERTG